MFALPGILLLLVFVYVRPQEFLEQVRAIPFLYLFCALAAFGLAVDLKLRISRPTMTPHLPWVIGFLVWCIITLLVRAPDRALGGAIDLAIPVTLYALLAHGIQSFKALQLASLTVLLLVLFVAGVGVHQGFQPFNCMAIDWQSGGEEAHADGRPCVKPRDCEGEGAEPGADYMCERVGLFGTSSIGAGRVRYRGVLQDPNFLALAVGIGVPFAFALFDRKRSAGRGTLLVVTLAICLTCAVFTKSRGGQLVFMAVAGAYFVRQYRMKGLLLAALFALPLMLFGGRSGDEAESSSVERISCMYEGMSMFKEYPLFGVGQGQFVDHYIQTAHNSYVLAPAELGFPGFVLWSVIMYLSVKIPIKALSAGPTAGEAARVARVWGMAFTAGIVGLLLGILFLSFNYHHILWIYVGLSGALYTTIRTHDPAWDVKFSFRDFALVIVIDIALIVLLFGYTRWKGAA